MPTQRVEFAFDHVRDRRLPRAGQAGKPDDARLVALERRMGALIDLDRLPMDVLRPAQRKVQQPRADGVVGQPIDNDEAARVPVFGVRVEGDRLVEIEIADADFVQMQRLCRDMFERVDVDLVFRRGERHPDRLGADLQEIRPPRQHLVLAHPDDCCFKLVGDAGRRSGAGEHVAATDVDLVVERNGD